MNQIVRPLLHRTVALGVAGAVLLGALGASVPASAAPMPTSLATLNSAAPANITDVRWRHRGGWIAGGLVLGGLAAAAAYPYYYGNPYYYGPPPYAYGGPVYYEAPPRVVYAQPPRGPNGPVRQCWVPTDDSRGYGYWRPC